MASSFNAVPLAPTDPLFGLMAAYKADTFDKKVDLGVGAYRDDNAKPWILPVVKKVCLDTWTAGFVTELITHLMKQHFLING